MADLSRALTEKFQVEPGKKFKLKDQNPRENGFFDDEDETKAATAEVAHEIDALQDRLYAENTRSLLVILQGTDTAGKDGTIRGVFNETGPIGVSVTAFRQPTETELSHDYLWRAHMACPKRGMIGIFNRSHYEDVLVAKVRGLAPKKVVEDRYGQINAFEKMLTENGTVILKFMLHISKEEQKERLQERLDKPEKQWKFNPGDLEDRKLWDDFQDAYETMLNNCSTKWAPWYVIPGDRKWVRNAIVAHIVKATLTEMDPRYPQPSWEPGDLKID